MKTAPTGPNSVALAWDSHDSPLSRVDLSLLLGHGAVSSSRFNAAHEKSIFDDDPCMPIAYAARAAAMCSMPPAISSIIVTSPRMRLSTARTCRRDETRRAESQLIRGQILTSTGVYAAKGACLVQCLSAGRAPPESAWDQLEMGRRVCYNTDAPPH